MSLLALFVIAIVSLVLVRVGSTAFRMTGLSRDVSDFQAVSCFFGVGFTTAEAEMIVTHSARRRIATHLIVAGNLGLTSALGALIVTFVNEEPDWLDHLIRLDREHPWAFVIKLGSVVFGIVMVVLLFRVGVLTKLMDIAIRKALHRFGAVRAMDYDTLLQAQAGYVVSRYEVDPGHAMIGHRLGELGLGHRGALVLGVRRAGGEYVGAPDRETMIEEADVLTLYGHERDVRSACGSESVPRQLAK